MAVLRKRIAVAALMAVLAAFTVSAQDTATRELPKDYKSDRCTMFFDCNYADCCVEHDKAYFFGGTREQRRAADAALYRCVKARGHGFVAKIMWLGVRVGGVGFLPTPFRWGFGKNWKPNSTPERCDRRCAPNLIQEN